MFLFELICFFIIKLYKSEKGKLNDKSDLNLYYKELIENVICSDLWKEYVDFFEKK